MASSLTNLLPPLAAEAAGWCLRFGLERWMGLQVKPALADQTQAIIQRWLETAIRGPAADSSAASAPVAAVLPPATASSQIVEAEAYRVLPVASPCPVCQLHDHLAIAHALMAGIAQRQGDDAAPLPKGLGGTVPLVRQRVAQAQGLCGELQAQGGLTGSLAGHLNQCLAALEAKLGWVESMGQARALEPLLAQSWKIAHRLAQLSFSGGCPGCQRGQEAPHAA